MIETKICPKCGAEVPANAPRGICPKCLMRAGLAMAEELRERIPGIRVELNLGGGSFKSQMKRADKSQAEYALILGEQELADEKAGLKPLRGTGEQASIAFAELATTLADRLGMQPA